MPFKVLYAELQPCVLIACECSTRKPFLLLIRSMNQTVTCTFCRAQYAIDAASYSSNTRRERPAGALRIKRTPPADLAASGQLPKLN
jgi:hypothetical protein